MTRARKTSVALTVPIADGITRNRVQQRIYTGVALVATIIVRCALQTAGVVRLQASRLRNRARASPDVFLAVCLGPAEAHAAASSSLNSTCTHTSSELHAEAHEAGWSDGGVVAELEHAPSRLK
eukprot:CAMPEP_0198579586 /NCGR_PEP_ID=MMETSP1462-20131121/121728_1 /TAXON_ID=1333877 /ORGANISM="Brandtodinium nutriculum, Strain RCC3387" /LENGTH=123 /DNA_ID=CAMNT_0044310913 /DNA_START=405 /DNA_END=777 /DNA_ORIENTATION=-